MKNTIRIFTAALLITAFALSLACVSGTETPPNVPGENANRSPTPEEPVDPPACTKEGLQSEVDTKLAAMFKDQYKKGFNVDVFEVAAAAEDEKGQKGTAPSLGLRVTGKLYGPAALNKLNGVIQPLLRSNCVRTVEYSNLSAAEDGGDKDSFFWSFECPDGMQVCSGGICEENCGGRERGSDN